MPNGLDLREPLIQLSVRRLMLHSTNASRLVVVLTVIFITIIVVTSVGTSLTPGRAFREPRNLRDLCAPRDLCTRCIFRILLFLPNLFFLTALFVVVPTRHVLSAVTGNIRTLLL